MRCSEADEAAFAARVEAAVHDVLSRNGPFATLVAAVSGGADSCALLAAVAVARKDLSFSLACIHVDHGLRGAAAASADLAVVSALCRSLDVPLLVARIPPGTVALRARTTGRGIEDAARSFRRAAYRRALIRFDGDRILLGHSADDADEGALLRVLRGSGPIGLIPLPEERGRILRPLLSLRRAELRRYLGFRGLPWSEDVTNSDTSFLRNRIRLDLVPLLDERFPSWRGGLRATIERQVPVADYLKSRARRALAEGTSDGLGRLSWDAAFFDSLPRAVREELVLEGIDRVRADAERATRSDPFPGADPRRVSQEPRYRQVRRFCDAGPMAVDLGPATAKRSGSRVSLEVAPRGGRERGFSALAREPGRYRLPHCDILVEEHAGISGMVLGVSFPLVFRPLLPGDRLRHRGRSWPVTALAAVRALDAEGRMRIVVAEDRSGIAWVALPGRDVAIHRDSGESGCSTGLSFSIL